MLSVFKNINRLAGKSKLLDFITIFFARYFLYCIVAVLFLCATILYDWHIFLYPLFAGLFGVLIVNRMIYIFYKEQRPAGLKNTKVLIPVPQNPSFPSSHASFLFGVSFYLFFYSTPLAVIFIIFSCLVGIARVFCGVHWFRDILAGAFVGFLSALMAYSLLNIFVL